MPSLPATIASRLPLIVSVAAHVAVAAAAGFGGAGHAPLAPARADEELTIDLTPPVEAPKTVPLHDDDVHVNQREHHTAFPPHTHPYPLPPGHDDTPHDPSIDHRHPATGASAPAAPPVAAAPSVIASPDPVLPHFTIALGTADATSGGLTATSGQADHGAAGIADGTHGATGDHAEAEYEAPMVTVPARLVSSVRPEYPEDERAAGVEADVGVEIVVDATGAVVASRVVRHAGRAFDDAALRAVRRYRFSPAQVHGGAVRVRMPWLVSFRLE